MEFLLWCAGFKNLTAEAWMAAEGRVQSLAGSSALKDPALPQQWHRLQLWLRFNPWPRNLNMLWGQPFKMGGGEGLGYKWGKGQENRPNMMKYFRNTLGILFYPPCLRIALSHTCFGYKNYKTFSITLLCH